MFRKTARKLTEQRSTAHFVFYPILSLSFRRLFIFLHLCSLVLIALGTLLSKPRTAQLENNNNNKFDIEKCYNNN